MGRIKRTEEQTDRQTDRHTDTNTNIESTLQLIGLLAATKHMQHKPHKTLSKQSDIINYIINFTLDLYLRQRRQR